MSIEVAVKLASDRIRDKADNYPTPIECCRAAMGLIPYSFKPKTILDPGAGLGPWGQVARENYPKSHITGIELRSDVVPHAAYDEWFQGSFIPLKTPVFPVGPFKDEKAERRAAEQYAFDLWASQQPLWMGSGQYDMIIGNPPYKYAEQFIHKSMLHLRTGGHLALLLRLAFLEGQGRYKKLWPIYTPHTVAPLTRRPSFTGNMKTDATAYAMFYFVSGHRGTTHMTWLDWDYEENNDTGNNGDDESALSADSTGLEHRAAA